MTRSEFKIIERIKNLKSKICCMDETKTMELNGVSTIQEDKIEWHSTQKEMPIISMTVLLRTKNGYMFIGYYDLSQDCYIYNEFTFDVAIKKDEVVAWCPVPKYDLND